MPSPWHGQAPHSTDSAATADAELVRGAQASTRAFGTLYQRYRDPILSYCFYRLGDRAEAEDAASVIFLKALDHLPRFVERGNSFRTWLFSIAHNEITDRHRQRQRRPVLALSEAVELQDHGASPEEMAIARDDRTEIEALLALVPGRERSVLELRAAQCSTREIAQILRISEQNVRTAQSRGLSRLRRQLTERVAATRETIDA
jgi:RNA polymerase sigma-70 factor (ECF subfamily)